MSGHGLLRGKGFFDDLWSGIKSAGGVVVDKVLPKVIDVGLPIAVKALSGAGKRKRKLKVKK